MTNNMRLLSIGNTCERSSIIPERPQSDYWRIRLFPRPEAITNLSGLRRPKGAFTFAKAVKDSQYCLIDLTEAELADELENFQESLSTGAPTQRVALMALIAEFARRSLGLSIYQEQLAAVACMLNRRVVDMATGEGKSLVGFVSAAALALIGRRVHVISANEYLARRDAASGTEFFARLGLTVGSVESAMSDADRSRVYRSDVVYATAHQVGFDALHDRLRAIHKDRILPCFDVALIDEIDAVLIDDAAVPLVISGERQSTSENYRLARIVAMLAEQRQFEIAGDQRSVEFTDKGLRTIEEAFNIDNIFDQKNCDLLAAANVSLHAEALLKRDVHYVISQGGIALISEPRGRIVEGQRWPDGLQTAVELKEGVNTTGSTHILDQLLIETLAREYRFLSGMSGSAREARERLSDDFDLETVIIPPHCLPNRVDHHDRLYLTSQSRDTAAVALVVEAHRLGQPVLIGTQSVTASYNFAQRLRHQNLSPRILNAKNHVLEAEIISQAGNRGAITVSTQMAGRGVDIRLSEEASQAGGLLVIGLERFGTRRLDRQLRGRAGRQGDPGRTVFYTSLNDAVFEKNLSVSSPPSSTSTGEVEDRGFVRIYEHAQRIQEGKDMQLHRINRQYSSVIDGHRRVVLALRESLLACSADVRMRERCKVDPPVLWGVGARSASADLIQETAICLLDRSWSEHLSQLSEVREGIHLRVLGRENPLHEFISLAAISLATFTQDLKIEVEAIFAQATAGATTLSDLGLSRPTSTWTYTTTDNPFGTEIDRIVNNVRVRLRRGRPRRIEYK